MTLFLPKAIGTYSNWLHLQWPAGKVEKLPKINEFYETNLKDIYIAGDLTGTPLLKFALNSSQKIIHHIHNKIKAVNSTDSEIVILGAGVSGLAAAMEAKSIGLKFRIFESNKPLATIENLPAKKPIYLYPQNTSIESQLKITESSNTKEKLLFDLNDQIKKNDISVEKANAEKIEKNNGSYTVYFSNAKPINAKYIIIALGKTGNFNKLNVKGENLPKVYNKLYDPVEFKGKNIAVVGGGDTALETAIAIAKENGIVSLIHRSNNFEKAKIENQNEINSLIKDEKIKIYLSTTIKEITQNEIVLSNNNSIKNDIVFTMIGREAPLDFFRKSNIEILGEKNFNNMFFPISFLILIMIFYYWKNSGFNFEWQSKPNTFVGAIKNAAKDPGFYYSSIYSLCVLIFGLLRIKRVKIKYVKLQTYTLMFIQWLPLFILPYFILPWLHENQYFNDGLMKWIHDQFFPNDSYWRSFGFILAWPLFIHNVFTNEPIWAWLILSFIQTFVFIPVLVYYFGKGAYCGWICSCGALAETLGDGQRNKMPHGKNWNKLNMAGQLILAVCFAFLFIRIIGWTFHIASINQIFENHLLKNYKLIVDIWLSGVLGVGLYFIYSGRVWCRFFCPLAALMNIYSRFSVFRIFAKKEKCISCNLCTSVCHQGIDVMNFANKGLPMQDPECVRCSACVTTCPTNVLSFGIIDKNNITFSNKQ